VHHPHAVQVVQRDGNLQQQVPPPAQAQKNATEYRKHSARIKARRSKYKI
jgi:hypothetical protein